MNVEIIPKKKRVNNKEKYEKNDRILKLHD